MSTRCTDDYLLPPVAAPPAGIDIINSQGRAVTKVEIAEKNEVELECRVRESKPAATIVWYRDNVELKLSEYPNDAVAMATAQRGWSRWRRDSSRAAAAVGRGGA